MKNSLNPLDIYKLAPSGAVRAADRLLSLKPKYDVWYVIGEIMKVWEKSQPSNWTSHLVHLRDVKESRKVTTVGGKQFAGVSKSGGAYLAYLIDMPEKVVRMIRALYNPNELPFNKKFYMEFARRFPKYRVMNKV